MLAGLFGVILVLACLGHETLFVAVAIPCSLALLAGALTGFYAYWLCLGLPAQAGQRLVLASALCVALTFGLALCLAALNVDPSGLVRIRDGSVAWSSTFALVHSAALVFETLTVVFFLLFLLRLSTVVGGAHQSGQALVLLGLFLMALGSLATDHREWFLVPAALGLIYLLIVVNGLVRAVQARLQAV
jgi:hypothetical protein